MPFITPDWPAPANVRAVVTTRTGGVSSGRYADFNLATHVGDDPAVVATNRTRLATTLGFRGSPCWLNQVHGADCINAAMRHTAPPDADASCTTERGKACAILTADCLPILLCDRAGSTVAAIHAGWRGLAASVIGHTLQRMPPAGDLLAWIGPGIGPRAYRVGDDLRSTFLRLEAGNAFAFTQESDGWHCDLAALARRQLELAGVADIRQYPGCTHDEPARFFSFRRDGETGRMASLIWLA